MDPRDHEDPPAHQVNQEDNHSLEITGDLLHLSTKALTIPTCNMISPLMEANQNTLASVWPMKLYTGCTNQAEVTPRPDAPVDNSRRRTQPSKMVSIGLIPMEVRLMMPFWCTATLILWRVVCCLKAKHLKIKDGLRCLTEELTLWTKSMAAKSSPTRRSETN